MALDWKPLVDLVCRHRRFLLTTHIRPDADGIGSMMALAEVLRQQGKEVQCIIASVWPPRYDFLDPGKQIQRFDARDPRLAGAEAVIVLDTGTWNQLGDFGALLAKLTAAKMVIDHHLSQDDLGATRLVDSTAEATGRLVYEAITALDGSITPSVADMLFIALAGDTGWFRHSNATPATFALAEKLVAAGARPTILYELLYEQNTLPRLRLTGLVLERLQVVENGLVAFTEVRRGDYAATGAVPQDTEDLVNYPRSIAGVEVALFFMEQPRDGVKVSFRARSRVDVARLAERFGGGGHRLASGAIIESSLEDARARVLAALHEALGEAGLLAP
jgi:bifunctional oligoribonuclease and PAP phosphatase NrnA